jgi:preprotein translocase subunit SecF
MSGLATRLYRGEAGVDVSSKRRVWFAIAGVVLVVAVTSFIWRGFEPGIEFRGGAELVVPASVGTIDEATAAVTNSVEKVGGEIVSSQSIGRPEPNQYLIRFGLAEDTGDAQSTQQLAQIKQEVATAFGIPVDDITDNRVSAAWGGQVIRTALVSLLIFVLVVVTYLIFRFEWRMAAAAIASLILDLVLTAGVYSLVGFQVTPSTVIGFLTILGFALYDVVVVFDKVQENTKGITGGSMVTYPEAANLAVNQTIMRSINTGLVALLPVGGLLFIGAGLLGAGTLKDLGLVLFIGMGAAVYSSIFFATPVLVELKAHEPRYQAHTQRVLAKRASIGQSIPKVGVGSLTGGKGKPSPAKAGTSTKAKPNTEEVDEARADAAALAGATPRPGARTGQGKRGGGHGGRPRSGGRPGGKKR